MILAGRCAIAVMAKAPQPGRVKTRLTPMISRETAMRLSCAFLRDITENLAAAARQAPIDPYVAYAPAGSVALFDDVLAAGTKLVLADGSGEMPAGVAGFGRCLFHATRALFALGYSAVCVLNADSPTLPTGFLLDAATRLLAPGRRAVLGPADDGGYYLLGLQTAEPEIFSDIVWSTATVCAETLRRAQSIGLTVAMLPTWYDVDDAASLERLRAELSSPECGYPARFTRDELACVDVSTAS